MFRIQKDSFLFLPPLCCRGRVGVVVMGKRGPRPSPNEISKDAWTVKPDRPMRDAMAEDLATLRRTNPRATRSDVLRGWATAGGRKRFLQYQAELLERVNHQEAMNQDLAREIRQLKELVQGYEGREERDRSKVLQAVFKALRGAGGANLRRQLDELVDAELAGLELPTPNLRLAQARRELGSYRAIRDAFDKDQAGRTA